MSKPLLGTKIAVLAASGFNQNDLTDIQRQLMQAGAAVRIVSPEQGLVNSWNGESWGHHYAIDAHLPSALGADYGMLVIPGGSRSLDKLRLTAHTKRFVGSFVAAGKPVAVCGDAAQLMEANGFSGGNILSDPCEDEAGRRQFAARVVDFFSSRETIGQAA